MVMTISHSIRLDISLDQSYLQASKMKKKAKSEQSGYAYSVLDKKKKMITTNEIQIKSKKLISEGKTTEAITLLENFAIKDKPEFHNEIITLKNRLRTLKQGKRLNIISNETASTEESKLTYNILELIDELNNNYPQTKLQNNWIYFFNVIWGLIRKVLSITTIIVALIIFYYRSDVVSRLLSGKTNVPIEQLFVPTFVLLIGIIIFFHKK